MQNAFEESTLDGGTIRMEQEKELAAECFRRKAGVKELIVSASDTLGLRYALTLGEGRTFLNGCGSLETARRIAEFC